MKKKLLGHVSHIALAAMAAKSATDDLKTGQQQPLNGANDQDDAIGDRPA
ncbi:MAG TPA: hypothetical protein PK109_00995 [Candidatus Paceibacterota bacterium]|nr:hypothetical protein [Candidatus Paceibacterota bacterium]